ncbi:ABC transporter substrate-binding protein [Methylobacterium sp. J-026]|uniref:ABC transporter substrate-binding protein n=1 Tax=Methylobacterium sp. J-026 TaxID=2836624 RepID=UPI001FB91405|nr:ABC transporter substrate-binding protein [Methylobacterium sp. J-026]MCJ2135064.1 ABC transporter substrate-binding protein [Methylobacterium sp. J-026]
MRRRTVIAGLPWMLAGLPAAARAQARTVVAALWPFQDDDAEGRALSAAFDTALRARAQGEIAIDHRWGGADGERMRAIAADLVRAAPQVIFTYLNAQLRAVSALTRGIPIVFVGASDPVGAGLVASLKRPGGNITGFTLYETSLGGKWLAALREAVPTIGRVTLLLNPSTEIRGGHLYANAFKTAAAALAIEPAIVVAGTAADIDRVMADLARQGNAGLIVAPGTFSEAYGDRLVALAASGRIPAVFAIRRFAYRGALMSYGPDPAEAVRRAAVYVDRILRGDDPAALPIQAPKKFDLVVNLRTARSQGFDIPSALLAQADEVVE